MEAGKHGASSPEKDTDGVGRSYECTFCKRGFTNAQALGGHMNIHRKDKVKTKQKNKEEALNKSKEASNYSRFVPTTNPRVVGGQMGYQLFLPSWNPNFQTGNYLPAFWPSDLYEGRMEANLSLRVGAAPPHDGEGGGRVESSLKENEVDLELRLGPI